MKETIGDILTANEFQELLKDIYNNNEGVPMSDILQIDSSVEKVSGYVTKELHKLKKTVMRTSEKLDKMQGNK